MKQTLLFFVLLYSAVSHSQNLELVWHKGQPPVDVLYNGDENHVKMSIIGHTASFPAMPTVDHKLRFRTHIANVGHQVALGVQLVVVQMDSTGATGKTLWSIPVDSLMPGDTSSYSQTLTDSISSFDMWLHSHFVFYVKEMNKPLVAMDTLYMRSIIGSHIFHNPVSTDFGNYANTFTTDSLGYDAYGFAFLMPVGLSQQVTGIQIPLGPQTVAGGDIQLEIYDSSAYNPITASFTGNAFYTGAGSITPGSANGPQKTLISMFPVSLTSNKSRAYYWFVVRFFSNGGYSKIELYNDTTISQPDAACLVFTKNTNGWVPVSQGPKWLQNPAFTLSMYLPVFEPIQLVENAAASKNSMVYPNPTSGIFYLKGLGTQTAALKIYNSSGQEVLYQARVQEQQSIQLHHQPAGLYLVQVLQKGKVLYSTKLLLQP